MDERKWTHRWTTLPGPGPTLDATPRPTLTGRALDRQILALAVPALGALVAEPLFVLVDSVMVGHLGTAQLAGLSLSSTLLTTAIGVFIFLAYATTAATARRVGAGDRAGGVAAGIDGMWLGLVLGLATAAATFAAAPWIVDAMGAPAAVAPHAVAYLRASAPGLPGMLLVLAATGTLRGLLDTRTPLVVATAGAISNVGLNALFIYGLDLGVAGSGLGTAVAQTGMGLALVLVVLRGARGIGVSLRPHPAGIWSSALAGAPLFVRTLSLRLAILATIAVATSLGAVTLAAHQVVNAMWGLAAFALDALAIAAQALVGRGLGAGDRPSGPRRHEPVPALGHRRRGRRSASSSPRRAGGWLPCSRATTACASPPPSGSPSPGRACRSPAGCTCSTACSSAPATGATWRGRASPRSSSTCRSRGRWGRSPPTAPPGWRGCGRPSAAPSCSPGP